MATIGLKSKTFLLGHPEIPVYRERAVKRKHVLSHSYLNLHKLNMFFHAVNKTNIMNPLQSFWMANSFISVLGIICNSLVLWIFFHERKKLVTSVNAMIMYVGMIINKDYFSFIKSRMCALNCMLYSVVCIWRALLLMFGETVSDRIMIDHETVSIIRLGRIFSTILILLPFIVCHKSYFSFKYLCYFF